MIEHVLSVNCRVVHRGNDYAMANNAWKRAKASMKYRDVACWDHESTVREDFAPGPHCGLVAVTGKWILRVAQFEANGKARAVSNA